MKTVSLCMYHFAHHETAQVDRLRVSTLMTVHLVNPSHLSFGIGVITPRWLFVLAAATPGTFGCPRITDETLEAFDASTVEPGDIVGVGIHTGNALRGYEIGTAGEGAWGDRDLRRRSRHAVSRRGAQSGRRPRGCQRRW